MTEAVLESHRRALALAQQATTARVCALERYAAQVRVTDAARLDWQSALKIAGLNDRYLDLLARTAADDQAIAEITILTGKRPPPTQRSVKASTAPPSPQNPLSFP